MAAPQQKAGEALPPGGTLGNAGLPFVQETGKPRLIGFFTQTHCIEDSGLKKCVARRQSSRHYR